MSKKSKPNLLAWIYEQPESQFPQHNGITFPARLKNVCDYMDKEVHPHVEKGALLNNEGFLNNHGVEHIQTVIQRASELLSSSKETFPQFSAYECYLLVLAIHFHDVGNIFGREEHEKNHTKIMKEMVGLVGDEMVERVAILKISQAHGGRINGDKDTISTLPRLDPVLGQDVRYQALAAVLRFADELADDSRRAHRMPQRLDIIPDGSKVFHEYSKSLHSVKVSPEDHLVDLRFVFNKATATKTFGKRTGKRKVSNVFLLDEIFERTMKMHFERKYCMRFMQGITRFDAINVTITIFDDEQSVAPCCDPIGYRLEDRGYPSNKKISLSDICPDVKISGAELRNALESTPQNVE